MGSQEVQAKEHMRCFLEDFRGNCERVVPRQGQVEPENYSRVAALQPSIHTQAVVAACCAVEGVAVFWKCHLWVSCLVFTNHRRHVRGFGISTVVMQAYDFLKSNKKFRLENRQLSDIKLENYNKGTVVLLS